MTDVKGDGHRLSGARGGVRDGPHNTAGQTNNNSQQVQSECAEGPPDGDMSDSSLSAHDGGGGRVRRYELARSKKQSTLTGAISEPLLVSVYVDFVAV